METDYFIYKVTGWFVVMLFTLQPVGQYESLSDEREAWGSVQTLLLESEMPACVDLPSGLNATPAVRLRHQHTPEPPAGLCAEKETAQQAFHPLKQTHTDGSGYVRRRSTLCTYRL